MTSSRLVVSSNDNENKSRLNFYEIIETGKEFPVAREPIELEDWAVYSSQLMVNGEKALGITYYEGVEVVIPSSDYGDDRKAFLELKLKENDGINGCASIDDLVIASVRGKGLFAGRANFRKKSTKLKPIKVDGEFIELANHVQSHGSSIFYATRNSIVQADLDKNNNLCTVQKFPLQIGQSEKIRNFTVHTRNGQTDVFVAKSWYQGGGVNSPGGLFHIDEEGYGLLYREPLQNRTGTTDLRYMAAGQFLDDYHVAFATDAEVGWREVYNSLVGGSAHLTDRVPADITMNNENIFVLTGGVRVKGRRMSPRNQVNRVHWPEIRGPIVCDKLILPGVTDNYEKRSYTIDIF